MVAVLSHPDHAYQHGQAEQREADGGLGQPRAFGLEHQCHVHLQRMHRGGARTVGYNKQKEATQDTQACTHHYNLTETESSLLTGCLKLNKLNNYLNKVELQPQNLSFTVQPEHKQNFRGSEIAIT